MKLNKWLTLLLVGLIVINSETVITLAEEDSVECINSSNMKIEELVENVLYEDTADESKLISITTDYFDYSVNESEKTAIITNCKCSFNRTEIPGEIRGYRVIGIGGGAFKNCNTSYSLTIPDSVTYIGDSAFYGCSDLGEITIPDSVTYIGSSAFYGCNKLTAITIPDGVTSIGSSTFYGCNKLTAITIPNSVTNIGEKAFYECYRLTELAIPNSVTNIGEKAFYKCYGLTELAIPNSVTNIGEKAFYECSGLTEVNIPNSVTYIGDSTFYGCRSLTEVTIPNSVTSIGFSAFYECKSLTEVTIPNSVTSIGSSAFYGCQSLTEMTIPNSVISIGQNTFCCCSGLTEVTILGKVTVIESNTFYNCYRLTEVTLPDSVEIIESDAFYECRGLIEVVIPSSVKSLSENAFRYCVGLTKVDNKSDCKFKLMVFSNKIWKDATRGRDNISYIINGVAIRSDYVPKETKYFEHWGFLNKEYPNGPYTNKKYYQYLTIEDMIKLQKSASVIDLAILSYRGYYDKWIGSCYGMSVTSILQDRGELPYDIKSNRLEDVVPSEKILSLINFYHMQQFMTTSLRNSSWFSSLSQKKQIIKIKEDISKYGAVRLDYDYKGNQSHSVVAYDTKSCDYLYTFPDGSYKTYNKCIVIYDNQQIYEDEDYYVYYDENYNWVIPGYGIASTNSIQRNPNDCHNNAIFSGEAGSKEQLNIIDYKSGKKNLGISSDETADSIINGVLLLYYQTKSDVTRKLFVNSGLWQYEDGALKSENGYVPVKCISNGDEADEGNVFVANIGNPNNIEMEFSQNDNISIIKNDIFWNVTSSDMGTFKVDLDEKEASVKLGTESTCELSIAEELEEYDYYYDKYAISFDGVTNAKAVIMKDGINIETDADKMTLHLEKDGEEFETDITNPDNNLKISNEVLFLDKIIKNSEFEYTVNIATKEKISIVDVAKSKTDGKDYKISYEKVGNKLDSQYASINVAGLITAKKAGIAHIIIKKCGAEYKITVNVFDPKFNYSDSKQKYFAVNVGEKILPTYVNCGLKAKFSLDSNSMKKGLAIIDSDTGEVTAIRKGNIIVSAVVGEGKNARVTKATVKIYDPTFLDIKVGAKGIVNQIPIDKTTSLRVVNGLGTTEWSVSDNSIVTIDNKGRLKTVGFGDVTVTAINNGRIMKKIITVPYPEITGIYSVKINRTIPLKIINGVKTTTWSVSDDTIATVKGGVIKGIKPGTVTVTAENNGYVMTKEITVFE